ncbi:hypothetical protein AQ490_09820 [Wenjunlia vitaminophila]|uniref:Uncharacterized protein n=1 Tax=Wenjunlia vitaminophila TaxID=76728 RepID=A0A0T6LM28_WENVI|nr:hypothetical protein [Wenjunlia vitaminophila]KRV47045.1 hypothetical protein AQ490_09820 [Wenjunlia vitaminophila]
MSLHDDLTRVQRTVDDLVRSVGRLEHLLGHGLDIRRVRTDADHLRESVALLRDATRDSGTGSAADTMVIIPDAPYDPTLWRGAEDEGIGSPHGQARP